MPAVKRNKSEGASRLGKKPPRLSRTRRPEELTLQEWQRGLRRQFAQETSLQVRNLGREPVFSEFAVANPETKRSYRVAIRGAQPGVNYCACPDYAVNTLGTCKHIEAVLHRLGDKHAAALRAGYQPPFAEVYVRYGAQRQVVFSPGTKCPPALEKLARRYFDADGGLKRSAFVRFDQFLRGAARFGDELRVYDDALGMIAEVRDTQSRAHRLAKYEANGRDGKPWQNLLKVPLYPYQREGAAFAARAGRAVIADDMGLGKTIQAIAAAEILARECGVERVLIVCPASLKSQWQYEIGQFSKRPALIIEGLTHQRKQLYAQDGAFFKIVNYDVIHRDLAAIAGWGPDLVILDEAQRIKNWQTRAARTVKRLESRYAFVLTGTPLENRIEELHSIVEFVDRHRLGPLFAFKDAHEIREEESSRVVGYQHLDRITRTLAPMLIRRTKQEVLKQLPPRMDKNFFVPMTSQQWVPHNDNREIVSRLVAKWRRWGYLDEQDQLRLRIALQYMRMSCDSTYLVDHETRHQKKVDELAPLLGEIFEDPDAKVVIFSQWLRMNELVIEMLDDRGWGHVHLHGGVPSRERKELTRALREERDCRVFLSTDAGGVGLNLQSASAVINMDLPWNPAVLEQRIGRVHRLGQRRCVRVVNFISEGTIEHGMLSLLAFKKSMFEGVLDGTTDKVLMGDSAMNRFMKTVETATSSVPIVSPTPVEEEGPPADQAASTDAEAETEAASPAAGPAAVDVQVLGQLLARGAEFLQNIGRALTTPASGGGNGKPGGGNGKPGGGNGKPGGGAKPGSTEAFAPRIETDAATGRPELRIALPDAQTIQHWVGLLSGLLGASAK